ncbi:hypothetical protein DXG03_007422 [Asterophora parasitica]|uniref:Uncharacterized protein n=1 Tax=Asterophora parasitica TaxID=117018 RepID=A0A9P7K858_9AGAR|nr:hypothetical protein DXG03_007422 [Asterophora parasitica]
MVLVDLDSEPMDYDGAARLLSSICPDFVKDEHDLELGSPESFGALLHQDFPLFDLVKKARDTGNFEEALITGGAKLPSYSVDHLATDIAAQVKAFGLHSTREADDKTPVMLLHNLGSFRDDPVLNERIRTIFRQGQNTYISHIETASFKTNSPLCRFLVNVSASGKTRLLYEGLCQHWGLYFTFHPDELEPRTLHKSSYPHILPKSEPLFRSNLPEPMALGFTILLAKNHEIVNRRFSLVLLVHLLVFREFLRAALETTDTLTDVHKYRWFLAQWWHPFCHLSPRPAFLKDLYLELFSSIEFVTLEYIDESFAEVTKDILSLLPDSVKEEGLFFAIDEANVGITELERRDILSLKKKPANSLGGHPRHFGIGRVQLVSSGVGRFVDGDMKSIAVDEPAPLVAAAMKLASERELTATEGSGTARSIILITSLTEFASYIQSRWENGETYRPASYIAFYLAHVFQNGAILSDVFTLPTEPAWARNVPGQLTQIVILHKDHAAGLHETTLGPSSLLPGSAPLGYAAQTPDDVHAWLSHERPAAFCICPPECGADLIFVLKHEYKYLWVALSTAGRGTDAPVDINGLKSQLNRLLPVNIFAEDKSDESANSRIADAFAGLPNGARTGGQYSLLRVVATFPSQPPIRRSVAQRIKDPPIAVLDTTKFQAVIEDIRSLDIVETLISSLQGRRQTYADENSVLVEMPLPSSPKQRDADVAPPPSSKRTKASGSRLPAPQPTRILPKRSTRNPPPHSSDQKKEPLPPPAESSRKTKKNPSEKPLASTTPQPELRRSLRKSK